uniref:G-protein coupled receptors family 1 profile domain-containing protein n=1 Tax=Hucho hucho TaxID=62062 RepID=A0A4W5K111_9TELE
MERCRNYTRVSEFVIVGFPGLHPSFYQLVAWFFFFIYVTTVVGNILLVVLFALERSLQKPMYIIMLSLALSDIGKILSLVLQNSKIELLKMHQYTSVPYSSKALLLGNIIALSDFKKALRRKHYI